MLKILFIGDIVGFLGREATKKILPKLKRQYKPDLIIANVENLAHGKGVTQSTLREIIKAKINCFTSGNHIFAKKEVKNIIDNEQLCLLRPANYPPQAPGKGEAIININPSKSALYPAKIKKIGKNKILLLNLIGRIFMKENFDCPFRIFDAIIEKYNKENLAGIIVDFHAEASSEKKAFLYYLDGRVSAVIGTHTHIQTADEQISKKGTAYITDVGMVGSKDSVIGFYEPTVIKTFLTQINYPQELPRQGECIFNAVLITIKNKMAKNIKRIQEKVTVD